MEYIGYGTVRPAVLDPLHSHGQHTPPEQGGSRSGVIHHRLSKRQKHRPAAHPRYLGRRQSGQTYHHIGPKSLRASHDLRPGPGIGRIRIMYGTSSTLLHLHVHPFFSKQSCALGSERKATLATPQPRRQTECKPTARRCRRQWLLHRLQLSVCIGCYHNPFFINIFTKSATVTSIWRRSSSSSPLKRWAARA